MARNSGSMGLVVVGRIAAFLRFRRPSRGQGGAVSSETEWAGHSRTCRFRWATASTRPTGIAEAHEVAGPIGGEFDRSPPGGLAPSGLAALPDGETADRVTIEPDRHGLTEPTVAAQFHVRPHPGRCRTGPGRFDVWAAFDRSAHRSVQVHRRPAGAPRSGSGARRTDVEHHGDVGAELFLDGQHDCARASGATAPPSYTDLNVAPSSLIFEARGRRSGSHRSRSGQVA